MRFVGKPCTAVGGELPVCTVCEKRKCPLGRDPGAVAGPSYCDTGCPGYLEHPRPGNLWPGEECDPMWCLHRPR